MKKKSNIFKVIRDQLAFNNARKTEQVLKLMGDYGYPGRVLNWLYRQGVLKIDGKNVKKVIEVTNGEKHVYYYVPYFDFDQSNHFCDIACDIAENEYIKQDKAGNFSNDPVTVKFGKIYDKYRQELECPNGCEDYKWETGTEYNPLDNPLADWIVIEKGYKDMQDFINTFEDKYIEVLDEYLKAYYKDPVMLKYFDNMEKYGENIDEGA